MPLSDLPEKGEGLVVGLPPSERVGEGDESIRTLLHIVGDLRVKIVRRGRGLGELEPLSSQEGERMVYGRGYGSGRRSRSWKHVFILMKIITKKRERER